MSALLRRATLAGFCIAGLLAGPAAAEERWWLGAWSGDPAQCGPRSDQVMRISETEVQFHESRCTLANPAEIYTPTDVFLDLRCTGEGEVWTRRELLILRTPAIMTMTTQDGASAPITYHRCP